MPTGRRNETEDRLGHLSLSQLINLYADNPLNKDVRDFICNNFGEKNSYRFKKSLRNIPDNLEKKAKMEILSARVCAREIINQLNFEDITNLEKIREIVSIQFKTAEDFT